MSYKFKKPERNEILEELIKATTKKIIEEYETKEEQKIYNEKVKQELKKDNIIIDFQTRKRLYNHRYYVKAKLKRYVNGIMRRWYNLDYAHKKNLINNLNKLFEKENK